MNKALLLQCTWLFNRAISITNLYNYRVTQSKSSKYAVGDLVVGPFGWRTHTNVPETGYESGDLSTYMAKLDPTLYKDRESTALGVLGMPGWDIDQVSNAHLIFSMTDTVQAWTILMIANCMPQHSSFNEQVLQFYHNCFRIPSIFRYKTKLWFPFRSLYNNVGPLLIVGSWISAHPKREKRWWSMVLLELWALLLDRLPRLKAAILLVC